MSQWGILQKLHHTHDAVERRADLMAHVGQKFALGTVGCFSRLFGRQQCPLGFFAFGDIAIDAESADQQAINKNGIADGHHLDKTAILAAAYGFLFHDLPLLVDRRRQDGSIGALRRMGHHIVDPASAHFFQGILEQGHERLIDVDHAVVVIQNGNGFKRPFKEIPGQGRLPAQGLLGFLAIRDVATHADDGLDLTVVAEHGLIGPGQPAPPDLGHGPLFQIGGMGRPVQIFHGRGRGFAIIFMHQRHELPSQQLFPCFAEKRAITRADEKKTTVAVHLDHQIILILHEHSIPLFALAQQIFGALALGHITKDGLIATVRHHAGAHVHTDQAAVRTGQLPLTADDKALLQQIKPPGGAGHAFSGERQYAEMTSDQFLPPHAEHPAHAFVGAGDHAFLGAEQYAVHGKFHQNPEALLAEAQGLFGVDSPGQFLLQPLNMGRQLTGHSVEGPRQMMDFLESRFLLDFRWRNAGSQFSRSDLQFGNGVDNPLGQHHADHKGQPHGADHQHQRNPIQGRYVTHEVGLGYGHDHEPVQSGRIPQRCDLSQDLAAMIQEIELSRSSNVLEGAKIRGESGGSASHQPCIRLHGRHPLRPTVLIPTDQGSITGPGHQQTLTIDDESLTAGSHIHGLHEVLDVRQKHIHRRHALQPPLTVAHGKTRGHGQVMAAEQHVHIAPGRPILLQRRLVPGPGAGIKIIEHKLFGAEPALVRHGLSSECAGCKAVGRDVVAGVTIGAAAAVGQPPMDIAEIDAGNKRKKPQLIAKPPTQGRCVATIHILKSYGQGIGLVDAVRMAEKLPQMVFNAPGGLVTQTLGHVVDGQA